MFLSECTAGNRMIAIKNIADKVETFGFGKMLGPFNEGNGTEGFKGGASLEVPCFVCHMRAENLKAVLLCNCAVFCGREMEIRVVESLVVTNPARGEARFFNDIFEALALALRDKAEPGLARGFDRSVDGFESER